MQHKYEQNRFIISNLKFCLVQKQITAFARIRSQQDSALYPDAGFTLIPH